MLKLPCLLLFVFLCTLSADQAVTHACGWWGDGGFDDDAILVDSEGNPVSDEKDPVDDPRELTRMGNRYKTGRGVARNYESAVYMYTKAAEKDFPAALNNLAVMYEQGLGVSKDLSEAAKWYRRAAERNDAMAQHSIGTMYRDGRGVPLDPVQGAEWIRKAAEQGHAGAFGDMGELYWKGSGFPKDSVLACMWWKLGVLHGDTESRRMLGKAAGTMESSSIKEAERLAQEWMEQNK